MTDKYEDMLKNISPLPWKFRFLEDRDCVLDANGTTVCDNEQFYPMSVSVGDMKFITHAANHHQQLVEALEELYWLASETERLGQYKDVYDTAQKTLAAAKEIKK